MSLPTALAQGFDTELVISRTETKAVITSLGRPFYDYHLYEAIRRGYLKPFKIAGKTVYYKPEVEAFAKKWAERVRLSGPVQPP
jgi:hypothetical protein